MKQHLEEISTLRDVSPTKLHAIVPDNGRNMVKAIDDSSLQTVPCLTHTLQMVINDALKVCKTMAKV